MIAPDALRVGARVSGLDPSGPVVVLHLDRFGDSAFEVTYRTAEGRVLQRLLFDNDLARIEIVADGRRFAFSASGADFRLALEALRIRLAWLFDPYLAVTTSLIEPLPHQITAVYGEMLPRRPLRFLLADDPGAGKTIMAGLFIKELRIRGDLERCLVVAPGNLVEQWQDELYEKFGLEFDIFSRAEVEVARTGNPFQERDLWIARLDQLARNEDLIAKLEAAPEFDLVVVDEAHRMSATYVGGDVKYTKRYRLGQVLGQRCRHFLLMTATPHNGKDADFQLFMALLDADRFEGRFRDGVHVSDPRDLMRRMIKEELVTFDGKKLFPERRVYTVRYPLSPAEARLYEAVTAYVREEMNRADRIGAEGDDRRRVNVGFALQTLQRRLASSPRAIWRSLERRRKRLERRLEEERLRKRAAEAGMEICLVRTIDPEDVDELPQEELEELEEEVVDTATTARTIAELEAEIAILRKLEAQALAIVRSGIDAKWRQLSEILDEPRMQDPKGGMRKLVIFAEPRDTLDYLAERIRTRLGSERAVVVIHGGLTREHRKAIIEAFRNDPQVRVLVANDACGEGVNLQVAHLMINYDLPWNPNRIEQRFGRIHRIGQREVCHLWNLVAHETREGHVYERLLEKLEEQRKVFGDRVFDVLGRLFQDKPLRELLIEAIRYGDDPKRRRELEKVIEGAVDRKRLEELLAEHALVHQHLTATQVEELRLAMERAAARRLQPRFVQRFFIEAFERLGGQIHPKEPGRFEIPHVPAAIRHRDRQIGGRQVVVRRYAHICFDKKDIQGKPVAEFVHPGHPLLEAVADLVREHMGRSLEEGAILVDPTTHDARPYVLLGLRHAICDGRVNARGEPLVISERIAFVRLYADGTEAGAGPAPHLDLRPPREDELGRAKAQLEEARLEDDLEQRARAFAIRELVPRHLEEVRTRRCAEIEKVEREVTRRLKAEINYWYHRANELLLQERAGKKTRLSSDNARARAQALEERLERRLKELKREREIGATPPVLCAAAFVVPEVLLASERAPSEDPDARKKVEALAMQAVMEAEEASGCTVRDVSHLNLGWDIESYDPTSKRLRFIEVKGRVAGASTITLTCNELMAALNVPDQWILAIVEVSEDGTAGPPRYVRDYPFREPMPGEAAVTLKLSELLARAVRPSP